MTGPVSGIGPRERRWLVIFLALGSAYFAFLLAGQLLGFIGGFTSILLILFLAWLLAALLPLALAGRRRALARHGAASGPIGTAMGTNKRGGRAGTRRPRRRGDGAVLQLRR